MPTKTVKPLDLAALEAQATEAAQKLEAARAEAEAERRAAEVEARRAAAERRRAEAPLIADYYADLRDRYTTVHGGRIKAAEAAFLDAVRSGDGAATLTAWCSYRLTRRSVAEHYAALAKYEPADAPRDHLPRFVAERNRLWDESSTLDGGKRSLDPAEHARRVADWYTRAEKYNADCVANGGLGNPGRPASFNDLATPPETPRPRNTPVGPPERLGESFDAALGRALAIVEKEHLDAQRAQREVEQQAYIAERLGEATP